MQFKEPEGDIIVVDCAYDRADIAEAIAWYESRGYTFRSHAVYQRTDWHFTPVSLIFIKTPPDHNKQSRSGVEPTIFTATMERNP